MSEWWVSQAKFYCKFCNVWIADNKPTRQLHDGGSKHKFNVDEFNKKKRADKLHGAHSEREVQQQLAEIERAAKEALATDRVQNASFFRGASSNAAAAAGGAGGVMRKPPPPPPPPNFGPSYSHGGQGSNHGMGMGDSSSSGLLRKGGEVFDMPAAAAAADEVDVIEEDTSGIYEIFGKRYMQGQKIERMIHSGWFCEIFVEAEEEDDWLPAMIVGVKEVPVPYTTVSLLTFQVSYIPTTHAAAAAATGTGTIVEEGVRIDRLRLWVDQDDNVVDAEGQILIPKSAHNAADIAAVKQSQKDAKKAKKAMAEAEAAAAVKVVVVS